MRKDLAYFGQFGRAGVGYRVAELAEHLRSIFGTDTISNVAVVPVDLAVQLEQLSYLASRPKPHKGPRRKPEGARQS